MKNKRFWSIFSIIFFITILLWPKLLKQDPTSYFEFADTNKIFNISNAWNVLSNLPFLFVGIWGFLRIRKYPINDVIDHSGIWFALAMALTSFGSSYFHIDPNPQTLFWDRLPMAFAFSSLLALLLIDRHFSNFKHLHLILLIILSTLTVVNWRFGNGDLRPYILLQFMGGLWILLIAVFTPNNKIKKSNISYSLLIYLFAKICESYDQQIFSVTQAISGHTIKHLLAAASAGIIFLAWHKK